MTTTTAPATKSTLTRAAAGPHRLPQGITSALTQAIADQTMADMQALQDEHGIG